MRKTMDRLKKTRKEQQQTTTTEKKALGLEIGPHKECGNV